MTDTGRCPLGPAVQTAIQSRISFRGKIVGLIWRAKPKVFDPHYLVKLLCDQGRYRGLISHLGSISLHVNHIPTTAGGLVQPSTFNRKLQCMPLGVGYVSGVGRAFYTAQYGSVSSISFRHSILILLYSERMHMDIHDSYAVGGACRCVSGVQDFVCARSDICTSWHQRESINALT